MSHQFGYHFNKVGWCHTDSVGVGISRSWFRSRQSLLHGWGRGVVRHAVKLLPYHRKRV